MNNQILTILKSKMESLLSSDGADPETMRNVLKEELQFHVLNFIYHHDEYSKWVMYGGSALRIIHGIDRMSVDLDFEVSHVIDEKFLDRLKKEIEAYFSDKYGTDSDFLTISITNRRGLVLKFHVGEDLDLGYHSIQVHLKIDLNHFVAPKTTTERRPINHEQLSFVILTYSMSTLMASKIAAIFLRGKRGAGKLIYNEKGRDIYDLLWYMSKKIVPDPDYLIAKKIDAKDQRAIFDKLTLQSWCK
jgi:predicted nucleotidyltransferase component of viral defense system